MPRKILFVSTPVSPLGRGDGGGVETTILQLAPALADRGYEIAVVAPATSVEPRGARVFQIAGGPPPNLTAARRDSPAVTVGYGVVEAMWDCVRSVQDQFDLIVGMTYDWLSYFLTPYFRTPVIHWITVSSTIDVVDRVIAARFADHPECLAFYSLSQARTFSFLSNTEPIVLRGAVDTVQFAYSANPEMRLSWAARISREKGLEDALEVATRSAVPLDVCGKVQDAKYLDEALARFPGAPVTFHGLLPHERLAKVLGNSIAMLATPKWTEAFGLSMVEAMACGTPVIAYARGGPVEIIENGKSGFLIEPDDTDGMLEAFGRISGLRRSDARLRAEEFAIGRLVDRFERWIAVSMPGSS